MQVSDVDVPRLRHRLRSVPRITASRRSVRDLVAAARRKLEVDVAVSQPGQISRKIEKLLRDQMNDIALALDPAVN